jgi:hypothetical protein
VGGCGDGRDIGLPVLRPWFAAQAQRCQGIERHGQHQRQQSISQALLPLDGQQGMRQKARIPCYLCCKVIQMDIR